MMMTSRCSSRALHPSHAWVDKAWNMRFACPGLKDETPYESLLEADDNRFMVAHQDTHPAGGDFPSCRRLTLSSRADGKDGVNVVVELWNQPPREWPPSHVADKGAGINLDWDEMGELYLLLGRKLNQDVDQEESA